MASEFSAPAEAAAGVPQGQVHQAAPYQAAGVPQGQAPYQAAGVPQGQAMHAPYQPPHLKSPSQRPQKKIDPSQELPLQQVAAPAGAPSAPDDLRCAFLDNFKEIYFRP